MTAVTTPLELRLPFQPPYDWDAIIDFLAARAIPGVEAIEANVYRRSIEIDGAPGGIEVRPVPGESCLHVRLLAPGSTDDPAIVARARHLFDLDCDPRRVARRLDRDERLRALVRARPGLRVPGAWSPFEMSVRAILGQQVSVRGASTLAGRLVEMFGDRVTVGLHGVTHQFPNPSRLGGADLARIGIPRARAETLRALAHAVANRSLVLAIGEDLDAAIAALTRIKGIGAWTAHYIAMRALGQRDAFPSGDLGLRKALARNGRQPTDGKILELAESWRPYRAYAAMHLWMSL